ncbi:Glutamyl-tRNA(Gln) amidotransferase subunit A [Thalassovita gelatinovora]|uniref:Glutamyl-tRNA(Gln) amidotransferase subunit A n=1 Tax=Thalassovita gelatinovora TaxID=53501 RepID=A0A0P1FEZ7_THAGE|nr:amidase [Thalassovita gelatinovora]QIZ79684.1 amidase [Thalassovita gelatinovora]CUH66664.1 Glutamyl-tRNA(Gln) amidotransferase subunit A [Thalassovita gelatinovora]SEQ40114.1 amidase [Thalassovita gelatinovora]
MNLLDRDALEISALLESRELSAEELMKATLKRIEAVNGKINAIVSLRDRDTLIAEARKADNTPRRGWLHGMPLAVKDLANVAGIETSMGSPIMAGQVAKQDSVFVSRMRRAGGLFIGKTNTPEFGLGSHTFNPVHGHTHNPYDLSKSAGGSSGGAAAALASRMLSVTDGSDMMGSLRNPAAWCNVYGFRPSWGRVPADPENEMFLHQLSTNGPMGRSPADIAALLEVQSGWDSSQPHGFLPEIFLDRLMGDLAFARIGWLGDWGGAYAMESGVMQTCTQALKSFERMGSIVEEIAPPFPAEQIWDAWITLRSWSIAAKLGPLLETHRDDLKPEAIWEIERGLKLSAMEVNQASVVRSQWFRKAAELFEDYDLLVMPTAQVWPFPVEKRYPKSIAGKSMDTYHRWMEVVVPVSLIGLPCLSAPIGFGENGLPMGLQLIGPARGDLRVLQLGQAWHEGTGFPGKHPPNL